MIFGPSEDKLSPERTVRLLRAKAAQLETYWGSGDSVGDLASLALDIALIAAILADHIERTDTA